MSKQITTTGTIDGISRLLNTPSGNPRWRIGLHDGRVYVTAPDSAIAGEVGPHMVGMPVTLTATRTGLIVDVRPNPEAVSA